MAADPSWFGSPRASTRCHSQFVYEGFTYRLASGVEGSVHADQVLHANQDPAYLTNLLLYELTARAREQLERSPMTVRALSQLQALDCKVEIQIRCRKAA